MEPSKSRDPMKNVHTYFQIQRHTRTICALAAQENLTLYQFDVKGAFLLAPCKEPVYMNLPGR